MSQKTEKCCGNCYCCAVEKETGKIICMNIDSRRFGDYISDNDNCSYFEPKENFEIRRNGIH